MTESEQYDENRIYKQLEKAYHIANADHASTTYKRGRLFALGFSTIEVNDLLEGTESAPNSVHTFQCVECFKVKIKPKNKQRKSKCKSCRYSYTSKKYQQKISIL
jgi:hypothetical protein